MLSQGGSFNRYIVECKEKCAQAYYLHDQRFNRYIVECKDFFSILTMSDLFVLIDTQWNVKKLTNYFSKKEDIVLIDTQWNVKKDSKGIEHPLGVVLIDTQWNVKTKLIS